MYISILTPTYNRAYIIENLFLSLKEQSCHDFEWIVVDDGSSDNTKELIDKFKSISNFPIKYIYKDNEGKHIAINTGVQAAEGEFVFFVDSDDYLTPDAIEFVEEACRQIEDDKKFAGVAGLRGYDKEHVIMGPSRKMDYKEYIHRFGDNIDATCAEYRYVYKVTGDRAEVVRRDIVLNHPFAQFDDEKYLSEDYLWNRLSKENYLFRWFSKIIYITEYRSDGLTTNVKKLAMRNWKGHISCANYALSCRFIPIKEKIRLCIRYYRYGIYGKQRVSDLFKSCTNKMLSIICIPIACLYKVKDE